jgi:lysophospholipase L1-like esterase
MEFTHYVSLGDSISTDDYPGEGKGAASLFYRNDDQLYPESRGHDLVSLYSQIDFVPLAQDGASSIHVIDEQLPKLKQVRHPGRVLFTLTAGGNDILAERDNAGRIVSRIHDIIRSLTETYPSCLILMGTVYDPTDDGGDLFEPGVRREREMNILAALNANIRTMEDRNIAVVDIHKHFLGHGLRHKDHPEDPSLWYFLTIEPNPRGAHEIRNLFWKNLQVRLSETTTTEEV